MPHLQRLTAVVMVGGFSGSVHVQVATQMAQMGREQPTVPPRTIVPDSIFGLMQYMNCPGMIVEQSGLIRRGPCLCCARMDVTYLRLL